MGFTAGQKVNLASGTSLYGSSDAASRAGTVSGTYYIWSAAVVRGRIRITNRTSYVGKTPAGTYVTGWINVSAIPAASKDTPKPAAPAASDNTKATVSADIPTQSAADAAAVQESVVSTGSVVQTAVMPEGVMPGQIGYLGTVVFVATPEQVKTIQGFQWEAAAKYATHDRHLKSQLVEFVGIDAQTIHFEITLSAYFGTSPMNDYEALRGFMDGGIAVPFKLGGTVYGHHRWVIENLGFSGQITDKKGNWLQATVAVALREYNAR